MIIQQKLNRVIQQPYWVAPCGWYSYKSARAASGHMSNCKQCRDGTPRSILNPELISISLSFSNTPQYLGEAFYGKFKK